MSSKIISVYVDYRLDTGVPFYVGKGLPVRVKSFNRNQIHTRISAKHGLRREIVLQTESNDEAMALEAKLIRELKTRNIQGGANLTDGGEGSFGWIPTEETRHRMSEKKKARVISDETCQILSEAQRKRFEDPAEHEKLSDNMRRMWSDPEFHQRVAATRVGEGNGRSKITEADVRNIRQQYDQLDLSIRGSSRRFLKEMASNYNVTTANIWGIVKRKSWSHIQ